jgi:hypothetical protein
VNRAGPLPRARRGVADGTRSAIIETDLKRELEELLGELVPPLWLTR